MTSLPTPTLSPYGDHAILVKWECDQFSPKINDHVHALAERLRSSDKYQEIVPGYDSLLCVFDLSQHASETVVQHIKEQLTQEIQTSSKPARLIEIPVHYAGEFGPDIERICEASNLSIEDLISLHSAQTYRVCMMGFIPGFTFLSPAPTALHHPRLETPRLKVPAGSIGLANWQTGIYGLESPGGWQIIGRTPLSIFDSRRDIPFLLNAGDRVRFIPQ